MWDPSSLKNYRFSPFTNLGAERGPRVGVPGHALYSQRADILLRWIGSSFQAVFTSGPFYFYIALLAVSVAVFSQLELSPMMAGLAVPAGFAATVNRLSIFLLTFFIGQCFSEANARFENVCKTNGNVTRLSALAAGIYPEAGARLLMRYINSIMHIYYFLLSGPLDEEKWGLLRQRGLLTEVEIEVLRKQGSPGVVIYSWAIKAMRTLRPAGCNSTSMERVFYELIQPMEEQFGGARGLAAKQIAYTIYQIPSIYFHIVYVSVNMFLVCTVYETGLAVNMSMNTPCKPGATPDYCSVKIVVMVVTEVIQIVMFLGLLLTAEGMADTYGNKPFNYDLGVDLDGLWQESQNVLKSMANGGPEYEL